jgi:hypothetical protein
MPLNNTNKNNLYLGNIHSNEFKSNLFDFIDTHSNNRLIRLEFYGYKNTRSGLKFRDVDLRERILFFIWEFPKDISSIYELILDKYYSVEDSIERSYQRDNCLNEYSDPFIGANHTFISSDYIEISDTFISPDYIEELDSDIYVDIIYKKGSVKEPPEK